MQPVGPIPVSADAPSVAGENVSPESGESNGERSTSPSSKPSALGVGSSGNYICTCHHRPFKLRLLIHCNVWDDIYKKMVCKGFCLPSFLCGY